MFMVNQSKFSCEGVTYYDTRKDFDCWVVLERRHRLVQPLKSFPIQERETFVIFDEARSRGSDMKLNPDATALLTLGPTITKDKLMQGAGRLRQLGRNQTLLLSSTSEVRKMVVRDRGGVRTVDVLDWVMANTQRQCTVGVLEWAHNGAQHEARKADKQKELQDDDWRLTSLYEGVVKDSTMYDLIVLNLERIMTVETTISVEILERAETFGKEEVVQATGFGEECERELRIDKNEEVEQEKGSREQKPCEETKWNFDELFSASSVQDCERLVQISSVGAIVKDRLLPPELQHIEWDSTQLFGTENFWTTISDVPPDFEWNGFMRMADAMIVFEDGSALMLAEGETDAVLQRLQLPKYAEALSKRRGRFGLVHLGYAKNAIRDDLGAVPLSEIPLSLGFDNGLCAMPDGLGISMAVIVVALLLNGETNFSPENQRSVVNSVLRPLLDPLPKREETLKTFIEKRRLSQRWSMSFLHDLSKRMDLKDWERANADS